jgi:hypothetical protein
MERNSQAHNKIGVFEIDGVMRSAVVGGSHDMSIFCEGSNNYLFRQSLIETPSPIIRHILADTQPRWNLLLSTVMFQPTGLRYCLSCRAFSH